ncbi:hypothetical protein [Streptomyces diastaticus]
MSDTLPAGTLRAAAVRLRDVAPQITGPLAGLADPVAAWLEAAARDYEASVTAADQVFHDDPEGRQAFITTGPGAPSPHALAVAHRILEGEPR